MSGPQILYVIGCITVAVVLVALYVWAERKTDRDDRKDDDDFRPLDHFDRWDEK